MTRRAASRSAACGAVVGCLWSSVAAAAFALGGRSPAFLAVIVIGGGVTGAAVGVVTELIEGERTARRATKRR
jgi:hypothetical protein